MIRAAKQKRQPELHGPEMKIEKIVKERYAKGVFQKEQALCCPVTYPPEYLKVIPLEILDKDYGCGDPTLYVREGDVVLDLGSGTGKACYIVSQIVGPKGKVIGIDFNPPMLALARKYQDSIGQKIGWHNVEFRWGRIQDLQTDLAGLEKELKRKNIASVEEFFDLEEARQQRKQKSPLVADESVDVIISNCVLNLVRPQDKLALFKEMHRVLKKGGRAAISDIVSDEPVPQSLQQYPKLWSGCLSGAFQEKEFLQTFEQNGFYGIRIEKRDEKPWRTVKGIEFRSVTVTAFKGKEGPCWERNQAVIYKGPWKQVEDDDHHILRRGVRTAVCDKTFQIYSKEPYRNDLILVPPYQEIQLSKAKAFDCHRNDERDPCETKSGRAKKTIEPASVCVDGGCC